MNQEVTIFLTVPDAELFKKFQKNHAIFMLMVDKGVFDQRNGNITMHFDSHGNIQKIERHDSLFDARIK